MWKEWKIIYEVVNTRQLSFIKWVKARNEKEAFYKAVMRCPAGVQIRSISETGK